MNDRIKIAKKITLVSIVGNVILSIIKIIAGVIGKSNAMIADGVHSISDVFTSIIAYYGVKISSKEDDKEHQYGHEKFELVASKILAIILIITGILIAYKSIGVILNETYTHPRVIAIYAAILSIIFKEWMYRYTIKGALLIDSAGLKADAWHHRSDSLSSIAALIGIIGAMNGILILEPIASILIAGFIIKIGIEIYIESVKGMIDTAASDEIVKEIRDTVFKIKGVIDIDLLKTRKHSSKIYVDIEISVDGNLKLYDSHKIAQEVHDEVEKNIENVKHCMVHVNPK
ncbi:MAG: cation diffusion facilitator family transporter [Bacillota bacterium]|nr:cation diffusion facilitator family transporter [Bacillota bacterium]